MVFVGGFECVEGDTLQGLGNVRSIGLKLARPHMDNITSQSTPDVPIRLLVALRVQAQDVRVRCLGQVVRRCRHWSGIWTHTRTNIKPSPSS